jgi:glycosyl transferase family 25
MFDFIDHVLYINLDHRTDRRELVERELAVFGDRV